MCAQGRILKLAEMLPRFFAVWMPFSKPPKYIPTFGGSGTEGIQHSEDAVFQMNPMPTQFVQVLIDRHCGTRLDAVNLVINLMVLIKYPMKVLIAQLECVNLFFQFREFVKDVVLFHC